MFGKLFGGKQKVPSGFRSNPKKIDDARELSVVTDTATVVIYDLAALKHRQSDACDWWTMPKPELEELNLRNVLILGLGSDGFYSVTLNEGARTDLSQFSLCFPTGEIFVGPGEELTGGDFEPTGGHGGYFISMTPGDYSVSAEIQGDNIQIWLSVAPAFDNNQTKPVNL